MPVKKKDEPRVAFSNALIRVVQAAERLDCTTHEQEYVNSNLDLISKLIRDLEQTIAGAKETLARYRSTL